MEQSSVRVEGARPRCPFCHDEIARAEGADLAPGEQPTVCPGCHALHHLACWNEAGACASCGAPHADAPPRPARSAPAAIKASPPALGRQTFIYEAIDAPGHVRRGEVRANDREEALQQIRSELGLFPTRCRAKRYEDDTFEVFGPAARRFASVLSFASFFVILTIALVLTGTMAWVLLAGTH